MQLIFNEDELPQRSDIWKAKRGNHIGGSDVAILTGDIPRVWDTPLTLFRRKLGIDPPKVMNAAMMRGTNMEDEAKAYIEKYLSEKLDLDVNLEPLVAIHPEYNALMVSFDGVDIKNKLVVEIKCQSENNFKKVIKSGIPKYYYPQVQAQLLVSEAHWGIDKAFFCSYYPEELEINDEKKQLACIDIEYNKEYANYIGKLCTSFQKMVDAKTWNDYWDIV